MRHSASPASPELESASAVGALCLSELRSSDLQTGYVTELNRSHHHHGRSCQASFPAFPVLPPRLSSLGSLALPPPHSSACPSLGRSHGCPGLGGELGRMQPCTSAEPCGGACGCAMMEWVSRALPSWNPEWSRSSPDPAPPPAGLGQFKLAPKIKCQCLFCQGGALGHAPSAASLRRRRAKFCVKLCK